MEERAPLKDHQVPNTSFNSTDQSNTVDRKISADGSEDDAFVCNICLDAVADKDPVVTQCGHLYCWPCLYRWLNTQHVTCPVCKAGVTQDNVIPIFIRGSMEDPRIKQGNGAEVSDVPNRPQGRRPEPTVIDTNQNNNNNTPNGANMALHNNIGASFSAAGFGFFPSLFGLQFQSFAPSIADATAGATGVPDEEEAQQAYLSRVLLMLGVSVILCLLFF